MREEFAIEDIEEEMKDVLGIKKEEEDRKIGGQKNRF